MQVVANVHGGCNVALSNGQDRNPSLSIKSAPFPTRIAIQTIMASNTAFSYPHFSELAIPVPSKNDSNAEQFTASQLLPSASSYNEVHPDHEAPITKLEQQSHPTHNTIFHKEEIDIGLADIKDPIDSVEWHPSQDLMGIVLGNDLKRPEFDIRLDDDVYIEANKQLEANIFPVVILSINSPLIIFI